MVKENEVAVIEKKELTAKEIKAQVNLIQSVMEAVMKDGVHYGKIPGCGEKPTLLKPGAEKIMATFRLAADPGVEDLSQGNIVRYRVTVKLTDFKGNFVGAGIGECSSEEEKYHWKKAICDEEFNATPEDQRREKWCKGYQGGKNYQVKQITTNKADVANTVLKMAKKRALIDAVLTATAASDIFNQDLEDMPLEIAENLANGKTLPPVEHIDEKQLGQIVDFLSKFRKENQPKFLKYMGVEKLEDIKKSDFQKAVSALEAGIKQKKGNK